MRGLARLKTKLGTAFNRLLIAKKSFFKIFFPATDLADHLRIKSSLDAMISSGGYDPSLRRHRDLLLSLLMTACDLSDQAKDWENSKNTAVSWLSNCQCQLYT